MSKSGQGRAAAEAVTRQRGGELLEINVDGDDTGARRFYERHGYVNSEPGQDQPPRWIAGSNKPLARDLIHTCHGVGPDDFPQIVRHQTPASSGAMPVPVLGSTRKP